MLLNAWEILREAAPFILLGFLLAGLLDALLVERNLTRLLRGNGSRSVLLATLIGIPLPLCSCSVLPTGLALRRKSAGKGATLSFLISTPETGLTSILLTYALLGPFMAIYRPIAACITALLAGLAHNAVEHRFPQPAGPATADAPAQPNSCACDKSPVLDVEGNPTATKSNVAHRWRAALRYAFVDLFDDIFGWIVVGIVVAAALQSWLPPDVLARFVGGQWQSMLLMLLVGVPLYVCAEASTPIAAVLMAQGLSPGAALVFLLVGPATNIGSIGVLARAFGWRTVAIYLASIASAALVMGWLANALLSHSIASIRILDEPLLPQWLGTAAAAAFLVLGMLSAFRLRYVPRLTAWVHSRVSGPGRGTEKWKNPTCSKSSISPSKPPNSPAPSRSDTSMPQRRTS